MQPNRHRIVRVADVRAPHSDEQHQDEAAIVQKAARSSAVTKDTQADTNRITTKGTSTTQIHESSHDAKSGAAQATATTKKDPPSRAPVDNAMRRKAALNRYLKKAQSQEFSQMEIATVMSMCDPHTGVVS